MTRRPPMATLFVALPGVIACGHAAGSRSPDGSVTSSLPDSPDATASVTATPVSLPTGLATACEDPWTIRLLEYDPTPIVPRRMYFASCSPDGGASRRLFVSLTLSAADGGAPPSMVDPVTIVVTDAGVGVVSDGGLLVVTEAGVGFVDGSIPDAPDPWPTIVGIGGVLAADLDPSTGTLSSDGALQQFPECKEMHGIAVSSDCRTIGVLCRRPTFSSVVDHPTKDLVAAINDSEERWWLTQPISTNGLERNDEEWLYEWNDGDVTAAPGRYVVHKAIGGGWEYGSQYLELGESNNTYALSLKSSVFGPDGNEAHQADALLIVNRSDYSIDTSRGWYWACGAGHTLFNHLAYSDVTHSYAVMCGTDLGVGTSNTSGFGGIWMRMETVPASANGFEDVPLWQSLGIGGGPTSLLALPDGGFVGAIAAPSATITANLDYLSDGPVTAVGVARFDSNAALVGGIHWVASAPGTFLSSPQLAPLGDGSYLLGYGAMGAPSTAKNRDDDDYRVPAAYYVMTVDPDGHVLAPPAVLDGAGWGEQDQLVALGAGRVAWAYTPNPARTGQALPACASTQLMLNVYAAP